MKLYTNKSVFEAALERIRFLFDEFENVSVNFSGGKDSTVTLELALIVAREKKRLPLSVFFLDQEIEWSCVIDYIRGVMARDEIDPQWLQVPFRMYNATSTLSPWLKCWEPGAQWMRDREPDSIHENVFDEDRYAKMYEAFTRYHHPETPFARIAGVRCEESPARMRGLTTYATYKHVTWGKIEDKRVGHFTFYPIYDWSYTDVWKAINDGPWEYCSLYDSMYQYGVPIRNMRVSNLHHETAVRNLFHLQEIESQTWERAVQRIAGINTAGHLQKDFYRPSKLPFMFQSWSEYRDHLLEKLIVDPAMRERMGREFAAIEKRYVPEIQDALLKAQIAAIITGDYEGTRMTNFVASNGRHQLGGTHHLKVSA